MAKVAASAAAASNLLMSRLRALAVTSISFQLDVRGLDDGPPLVDLRLVICGERLRRLLLAWRDLVSELVEPLPHAGVGQGFHGRGVELGDHVLRRALRRP